MKKNMCFSVSIFLIIVVLFSRLLPHAPNFTPIISVVLISSMLFKGKKYFFIPLLGLFLSDLLLDYFYSYRSLIKQDLCSKVVFCLPCS